MNEDFLKFAALGAVAAWLLFKKPCPCKHAAVTRPAVMPAVSMPAQKRCIWSC